MKRKALIVDNERETLNSLGNILMGMGIEVVKCLSAEEAVVAVSLAQDFDFVITDFNMTQINGIQLYNKIHHLLETNFILITNRYNLNAPEFMPFFAADNTFVLSKPFQKDLFDQLVIKIAA